MLSQKTYFNLKLFLPGFRSPTYASVNALHHRIKNVNVFRTSKNMEKIQITITLSNLHFHLFV